MLWIHNIEFFSRLLMRVWKMVCSQSYWFQGQLDVTDLNVAGIAISSIAGSDMSCFAGGFSRGYTS